jgi:hypothetical protein
MNYKEYYERMDVSMENLVDVLVRKGLMTNEFTPQTDSALIDFVAELLRNMDIL